MIELELNSYYNNELSVLPLDDNAIVTEDYVLNGAIAAVTTASQAISNRVLNNNNLQSGIGSYQALMLDLLFANFADKIVKGNWEAVDSVAKQTTVLVANVAMAALLDTGACYLIAVKSSQTLPLGQATLVALINSIGYFSAMASSAILNKRTYTKGPHLEAFESAPSNCRRLASGALCFAIAAGSAVTNRLFINSVSPMGIVLNMSTSEVLNRLSITAKKSESETATKIKLIAFYWLVGVGADVLTGLIVPTTLPFSSPWRYLSGTSIGATLSFSRLTASTLSDHYRELDDQHNRQRSRRWKMIAAAALSVAIPVCAVAAYQFGAVDSSPTFSLAIKMAQNSIGSLAVREMHKTFTSFLPRVAISIVPAALAAGVELVTRTILPVRSNLPVTSVAVGIASRFLGLSVTEALLGRGTDS